MTGRRQKDNTGTPRVDQAPVWQLCGSPGGEVRPLALLAFDGNIRADYLHLLGARNRLRFPTIESLAQSCIPVSCGRTANSARRPADLKICLSPVPSSNALCFERRPRGCGCPFHIPDSHHWQYTISSHALRNSAYTSPTLHVHCSTPGVHPDPVTIRCGRSLHTAPVVFLT